MRLNCDAGCVNISTWPEPPPICQCCWMEKWCHGLPRSSRWHRRPLGWTESFRRPSKPSGSQSHPSEAHHHPLYPAWIQHRALPLLNWKETCSRGFLSASEKARYPGRSGKLGAPQSLQCQRCVFDYWHCGSTWHPRNHIWWICQMCSGGLPSTDPALWSGPPRWFLATEALKLKEQNVNGKPLQSNISYWDMSYPSKWSIPSLFIFHPRNDPCLMIDDSDWWLQGFVINHISSSYPYPHIYIYYIYILYIYIFTIYICTISILYI